MSRRGRQPHPCRPLVIYSSRGRRRSQPRMGWVAVLAVASLFTLPALLPPPEGFPGRPEESKTASKAHVGSPGQGEMGPAAAAAEAAPASTQPASDPSAVNPDSVGASAAAAAPSAANGTKPLVSSAPSTALAATVAKPRAPIRQSMPRALPAPHRESIRSSAGAASVREPVMSLELGVRAHRMNPRRMTAPK